MGSGEADSSVATAYRLVARDGGGDGGKVHTQQLYEDIYMICFIDVCLYLHLRNNNLEPRTN